MIKWTEHYNIYSARIAKGAISLSVGWTGGLSVKGSDEPSGYRVIVGGLRLKKLYPTVEEGQQAAIALAKTIARTIMKDLE